MTMLKNLRAFGSGLALVVVLAACASPAPTPVDLVVRPGEPTPASATARPGPEKASSGEGASAADGCPITPTNPSFQPPPGAIVPSAESDRWVGNDALWTILPPRGVWLLDPHPDGSLSAKVSWWRLAEGALTIEGRRLDAAAPPLAADIPQGYGDTGFQVSGVTFPTEGCWEVIGKVGGQELRFVVRVQPPPQLLFSRPDGPNGVLVAYDLADGRERFRLPPGMMSADAKWFVAAQETFFSIAATVYDLTNEQPTTRFGLQDRQLELNSVSATGQWAVFRHASPGAGGDWTTRIQIVDAQSGATAHYFELAGRFDVDTFSADGQSLFLIEHLPVQDPDHYVVRLYDLAAGNLLPDPVRLKGSDEVMAGYAWEGRASRDGRWLLTLYLNTRKKEAFVHALNLVDKFPVCLDLPSDGGGFAQLKYYTLAPSRNSGSVYAANAALGVVAEISLVDFQMRRLVTFAPSARALPSDLEQSLSNSVLSPDGRQLYFSNGWEVWAYDTRQGTVTGPAPAPGQVTGLGPTRDGRLYVATADGQLSAVDPATGEVAAVSALP